MNSIEKHSNRNISSRFDSANSRKCAYSNFSSLCALCKNFLSSSSKSSTYSKSSSIDCVFCANFTCFRDVLIESYLCTSSNGATKECSATKSEQRSSTYSSNTRSNEYRSSHSCCNCKSLIPKSKKLIFLSIREIPPTFSTIHINKSI